MPSTKSQKEAEAAEKAALKSAEEAAKKQAAVNEADAAFREDVRKAAEKRAKAREKAGANDNIAERAWNETKAEDDPVYGECALDFRQKLDAVVEAVRNTGNADVVGLEKFEERARQLLAEQGGEPGSTALVPADSAGRPTEN